MIITITLTSFSITACNSTKDDPIYGDNTQTDMDITTHAYESCLNLITPKAYNDTNGLNMNPGTVISMITPTSSTSYWDSLKKGAMQAIEDLNQDLGYSGKDRVTLSFNTASNVDDQINILDSELSRYPSAIALAPIDTIAFGMQFDQAMENGIPIITFESSTTNSNVSAVIGTDHTESTLKLISNFDNLSDTPDTFFIVTSDRDSAKNIERVNAALSTYPDSAIENTPATLIDLSNLDSFHDAMQLYYTSDITSDASTEEGAVNDSSDNTPPTYTDKETISFILEQYKECENFLFLDADACERILSIFDTLEVNYSDYRLLSFDTSDTLKSAVIDSKVDGLLVTNPYGIGYSAIIASARAALDIGNEAFINTGHVFIDATTISQDEMSDYLY